MVVALAYEAVLKTKLGITVQAELAPPGARRHLTGVETRQKPLRWLNARFDLA